MLRRSAERDRAASPRQPIFNIPWSVLATLAVLASVQAVRQALPEGWDDELLLRLAFVPGRLTFAIAPHRVIDALTALAARGGDAVLQAQAARSIFVDTGFEPWTSVSYALLHADWAHLGLNGVWLLAFGTPLARRLRAARFFLFLAVAALAGAAAQWVAWPDDPAPVIGASASVSGCMGAALRFMFQPDTPLAAIVEDPGDGVPAALLPSRSLREVAADGRAVTFLAAWFVTNLVFGLAPVVFAPAGGQIAWQAHIGGFLAGLLLFPLFDPVRAGAATVSAPAAPSDAEARD